MNGIKIPGAVYVAVPGMIGVIVTAWLTVAYPEQAVAYSALVVTVLSAITGVIKLIVAAIGPKTPADAQGQARGMVAPVKRRGAVSRFLF